MKPLGLHHWLIVLLVAVIAHGGAFAAWHLMSAPDNGGFGGYDTGIRIALAPVQAAAVRAPSRAAPKPATRPQPQPETRPEPKAKTQQKPTHEPVPESAPEPEPVQEPGPVQKTEPAPQAEEQETKTDVPEPETRPEPEQKPEPKPEPEPEPEPAPKPEPRPEPEPVSTPAPASEQSPTATDTKAATTNGKNNAQTANAHTSSAGTAPTHGRQFRSGTTGSVADTPPTYRQKLRAWLIRHKTYPRRARRLRQEGTVVLYFVMARDGRVLHWDIRQSSGHELLDQAVKQLIRSANPMPALPDNTQMQRLALTVPIRFHLR